jgi:hypothetical protein
MAAPPFRESNLFRVPIRDLALAIEGTRLAPLIDQFKKELADLGITAVTPRFHLSTEWGVPFGTVVIGIPFYLARPELLELHREEVGHIEGFNGADILRYLRHEMGHVINYAYQLYEREDWVKLFGSINQPYLEDYRPQPFSRRFVRHLPGWYAQKHPDEDWAETFAVWMTPGGRWQEEYASWALVRQKLSYCDQVMQEIKDRPPPVTATELDEDVSELTMSLADYYKAAAAEAPATAGLDGDLKSIFDDVPVEASPDQPVKPAAALIRSLERQLMADVFRWTGHFPEKTRSLMRDLEKRADALKQVYPAAAEEQVRNSVTVLVTALAMNHVHRGSYFPEPQPGASDQPGAPAGSANTDSAANGVSAERAADSVAPRGKT